MLLSKKANLRLTNFPLQTERALNLCVTGDYDFAMGKLIPKPDHSHLGSRPLTTTMFAFSESSWSARADFHLKNGISKLSNKDWQSIMNGVAKYSSFIKPNSSKPSIERTEEEKELSWESDEESQ
jgi:hypothetical protein